MEIRIDENNLEKLVNGKSVCGGKGTLVMGSRPSDEGIINIEKIYYATESAQFDLDTQVKAYAEYGEDGVSVTFRVWNDEVSREFPYSSKKR